MTVGRVSDGADGADLMGSLICCASSKFSAQYLRNVCETQAVFEFPVTLTAQSNMFVKQNLRL